MGKSILDLMDEFILTATPESFLNDCERFGIKLEKEEEFYSSQEVGLYGENKGCNFPSNNQNEYCTAA